MPFVSIVLFLVGSTWMLELGGLEKEQLQYFNTTATFKQAEFNTTNYLGHFVTRFKVDIPESEKAPPIAAVAPFLDALSTMGFTVISHNDEYRAEHGILYLTWMLQKENAPPPETELVTNTE